MATSAALQIRWSAGCRRNIAGVADTERDAVQEGANGRARVLVVDDERSIRRLLASYLEAAGMSVLEAADGETALTVLRSREADIALLDVMLPGLDGFEVVRRARVFTDIPILLVTARGSEEQRVAGLELGADDYVVKPFSAPEVVARVRARLRRHSALPGPDGVLRFGAVRIDPAPRRCWLNEAEVELTRREFDLLLSLAEQPGRVLTRTQLLEAAWGTTFVGEKTVDVHMAALRRKLGDSFHVSAVRGIGYRLEP
jgi:two-component system alkaline phosphatase synthesis response regulator PhoP